MDRARAGAGSSAALLCVASLAAGLARAAVAAADQTEPQSAQQQPAQPRAESAAASPIDVDRLPLDLQRLERKLRQSVVREERDGLNLRYLVDVFGQAPRIRLFAPGDNLTYGPLPWGGPTHNDMLRVTTPKEFRAPVADFSSFMKWLSDKVSK